MPVQVGGASVNVRQVTSWESNEWRHTAETWQNPVFAKLNIDLPHRDIVIELIQLYHYSHFQHAPDTRCRLQNSTSHKDCDYATPSIYHSDVLSSAFRTHCSLEFSAVCTRGDYYGACLSTSVRITRFTFISCPVKLGLCHLYQHHYSHSI